MPRLIRHAAIGKLVTKRAATSCWRWIAPPPNSSRTAITFMRREQDPSASDQAKFSPTSRPAIRSSHRDGMSEDDMDGWKQLTDLIGANGQLVGDDLFVTNVTRLADGIRNGGANSILVKVNQSATLTETLSAIEMATRPVTPP